MMVCTEFQPENLKERTHLENNRAGGKTMFKGYLKGIWVRRRAEDFRNVQ
jgi:hypothetical protein